MSRRLKEQRTGFFGAIPNIFMHRWPPTHKEIFIDMIGCARTKPLHLVGVQSSPKDVPFPRIDRMFLDLSPDLCLDGCEPTVLTPEMRIEIGAVLEDQHVVKQWFPNNQRATKVKLALGLKLKVDSKRLPQLQHVYSHLLYEERKIAEKVVVEAKRTGLSPNNEWAKESDDVKNTIKKLHKEQKELSMAMKEHRVDDIELSTEQKSNVIKSLGLELDSIFDVIVKATGWGFIVVGAGIDPESGNLRSSSWEYGVKLKSSGGFFDGFDRDAATGMVPGGLPGDKRKAGAYYSGPLLAHM
ncbi:uncharacterized protein EV420DRAFT_1652699 [Desarmillaria tabescens]|uniref:Uncharacterized protein n=1 Tax=Armillaria tabescens TaxID=1929756 RepID=A0AA39MJK5_ARMTA|nr:uncharacterized protein EV420DRAFT_1652699 [Desarmillaria tabescens]KAK0436069.1 hypothetical protein EV420DRAFT_1652699 [Desarmillaria tabescens]